MCGIAAMLDRSGRWVEQPELLRMTDAMRHRGPDDEGWYAGHGVGLGNRRLAIIDLTAGGHQPMSQRGRLRLDHLQRHALQLSRAAPRARGGRPPLPLGTATPRSSSTPTRSGATTACDASTACSRSRSGMPRERRLMAARDRFGVKPLYWSEHDGGFVLGSELKVVLAAGVPRRLDPQAVVEYFTFQNLFSDRTLFAGVHALPAGCSDRGRCRRREGAALVGLRASTPTGRARSRSGAARCAGRSRRRSIANSRPTCRSAATSRADSTPVPSSRSPPSAHRA